LTKTETEAEPLPAKRHILVVDDNMDVARSMAMLLRAEGHEARTAFSSEGALEALQTWRPDVVLLDIGLPQMDGYEVARRMRAYPAGESAVLIAVTGWGQPEDRRRSMEAGFDFHVTKPVEINVIRGLLCGSKQVAHRSRNEHL
jgi:CheY-like chemotaxis protein